MIYLIGFMGSGKTTIAERLSHELKLSYIEMDGEIEKQAGMSISDMFEVHGESFFRNRETVFLKGVPEDAIISTGGGVILLEENRRILEKGTVIYLSAEWETIVERLKGDVTRPLWQGEDKEKKKRFEQRLSLYEEVADVVVPVDGKTPDDITSEIIARLK